MLVKGDHWCRIYIYVIENSSHFPSDAYLSTKMHKKINQCWTVFIYLTLFLAYWMFVPEYVDTFRSVRLYQLQRNCLYCLNLDNIIFIRVMLDQISIAARHAVASASPKWQIIQAWHLSYRMSWVQIASIILGVMGWIPNCEWDMDTILRTNRFWCSKIGTHETNVSI